jgi:hypothetical protein
MKGDTKLPVISAYGVFGPASTLVEAGHKLRTPIRKAHVYMVLDVEVLSMPSIISAFYDATPPRKFRLPPFRRARRVANYEHLTPRRTRSSRYAPGGVFQYYQSRSALGV